MVIYYQIPTNCENLTKIGAVDPEITGLEFRPLEKSVYAFAHLKLQSCWTEVY